MGVTPTPPDPYAINPLSLWERARVRATINPFPLDGGRLGWG